MDTIPVCPVCGKSLAPGAPQGLCPECLMKTGFETKGRNDAAGEKRSFVPPPVAEIAPLFPQLEIIELLGRGGMGAVYKARQPRLGRFAALKILAPEKQDDPQFAERFSREARTLAWLSHPNIVTIYDFGEVQGRFYFLMEYVDGLTLRQLLQAGKLSPGEALGIVPKICEALQYAHEQGVIHRDIKPENILLDKKGQVKITDFGIAKILELNASDLSLTGAEDVMGTPHYMAPEQMEKPQSVDGRADIFSLGVVFYEMLTGELPLGNFQPPSRKSVVDESLDQVVLRALEKEPERRYQEAREVKSDVDTIAGTSTVPLTLSSSESVGESTLDIGDCLRRAWKLVWSNFFPVAGITALILFLKFLGLCTGAGLVVNGPLAGGLWLYYIRKIRGETAGIGTAFSGFNIAFLHLALGTLVMGFLLFFGFLCLLVPGIYFSVAWVFALPLIVEKRLGFSAAMKLSRRTVSRHWWKLFWFLIILALINMAGGFLLFFGFLITAPITMAALACAYEDMFNPASRPAKISPGETQPVVSTGASGIWKFAGILAGLLLIGLLFLMFSLVTRRNKSAEPPDAVIETTQFVAVATTNPPVQPAGERAALAELPRRGLVALWSGEENGDDSVGTNSATLTDMAFVDGTVGRAFSLNGNSSCAKIPAGAVLDMENADGFTLSAWIKPADVSGFHPIVEWYSANTAPVGIGCQLRIGLKPDSHGILAASIVDMNGRYHMLVSPPDTVIENSFQHVAFTYDRQSGVGVLFLNGRIVAQSQWPKFSPKTKGDLWISCRPYSRPGDFTFNTFYSGLLDELALYKRALSEAEIQDYIKAIRSGTKFSPSGTVAAGYSNGAEDLTVQSAIFGAGGHITDVTKRVLELLKGQPDGFYVNASELGIDPKRGRGKILTIQYSYHGRTFSMVVPAGGKVSRQSLLDNAASAGN